ncbi:hypothetical protein GQ457_03G014050 [Hibiscus cannabinus]
MNRYKAQRRVQVDESQPPKYDDDVNDEENGMRLRPSGSNVTEDHEPFMGIKVRRKASLRREFRGDYLDVPSRPFLMNIFPIHSKHLKCDMNGDKQVLFADKVSKFTSSGKMKRRILMITDFAIYIVDP